MAFKLPRGAEVRPDRFAGQTVRVEYDGIHYEAEVMPNGTLQIVNQIVPPPAPPKKPPTPDLSKALEKMLGGMGKAEPPKTKPMPTKTPGYGTSPFPPEPDENLPNFDERDKDFQIPKVDNAFDARLRSIMTDNKYDRKLRGRTRGKLDMTNLHKVPMESRSVFTLKQARKNKNYNVVIVVDNSGSMCHVGSDGRSRAQIAGETTAFLVDALQKIGIRVGVVKFQRDAYTLKELDEEFSRKKIQLLRAELSRDDGDNNDYQAMSLGLHMLRGHEKDRNILIFMSDGEPAGGSVAERTIKTLLGKKRTYIDKEAAKKHIWDGNRNDFPPLVKRIKRIATPIGVGIQRTCWQAGDNNIRVNNLNEFKPALIKILERNIQRG